MSAVQGTQKKVNDGSDIPKYIGFASVAVQAINPTRAERNKLLKREDKPDDEEIKYVDEDKDQNERVRLDFWLYNDLNDKWFVHKIWISKKKPVLSKAGDKTLFANNTASTLYWPDEDSLPDGFKNFQNREKTESLGDKIVWEAYKGEQDLLSFVQTWLGRVDWFLPDCNVVFDVNKLFKEDYSELREQIDGGWDTPFIALFGVDTDETDTNKQYQAIFDTMFLPNYFMQYITGKKRITSEAAKKKWAKFEEKVLDAGYGFKAFYELVPLKEYNRDEDPAVSGEQTPKEQSTPTNSNY